MRLTLGQLQLCFPYAEERAPIYLDALNDAMEEFHIDTLLRQASFIAQVCHESGSLKYTLELADGRDYDITRNPELAARLGNTGPGDGPKYKGRGLIQITGKTNTEKCLTALGRNVEERLYLEIPIGASRSAGWFWFTHGLNEVADAGKFWTISKIINGGTGGLDERIQNYVRCRRIFKI